MRLFVHQSTAALVMGFLGAACSSQRDLEPAYGDGLVVTMAAPLSLHVGDSATLVLTVTNTTSSAIDYPLSLGRALAFDPTVSDIRGQQLWNRVGGTYTSGPLESFSLGPGERRDFVAIWNGRDWKGEPVPLGVYFVTGRLLGYRDTLLAKNSPQELRVIQ